MTYFTARRAVINVLPHTVRKLNNGHNDFVALTWLRTCLSIFDFYFFRRQLRPALPLVSCANVDYYSFYRKMSSRLQFWLFLLSNIPSSGKLWNGNCHDRVHTNPLQIDKSHGSCTSFIRKHIKANSIMHFKTDISSWNNNNYEWNITLALNYKQVITLIIIKHVSFWIMEQRGTFQRHTRGMVMSLN